MELCETTGSEMKYAHLLAEFLQCSIDQTITKEGRDLNVFLPKSPFPCFCSINCHEGKML